MKNKSRQTRNALFISLIILAMTAGCARKADYPPKKIAYLRISSNIPIAQLYLLDLQTEEEKRLEIIPDLGTSCPAWSPDGKDLLLSINILGYELFNITSIYIYHVDTTTSEPLLLPEGYIFHSPTWSPDGSKILLVGKPDRLSTSNINLYTYEMNTQTLTQITFETNSKNGWFAPAWSPDGSQILAEHISNWSSADESKELILLDIKDLSQKIIAKADSYIGPRIISSGDWAPDGQSIIYRERIIDSATGKGCGNIIQFDIETMEKTNLTECELFEDNKYPNWSSDGEFIVFTSNRGDKDKQGWLEFFDLYIMDANGKNTERLTTSGDVVCPAFQP